MAELRGGFDGKLANEEIPFMILEGALMIVACGCLTVFHPGYILPDTRRSVNDDGKEYHSVEPSELDHL